jgi:hypothetical protein
VPITIPLEKDIKQSIEKVGKVTSGLRSKLAEVYATYALTYLSAMLLPYYLLNWTTFFSTRPFTMAFSNTPGILKQLTFNGRKSIKTQNYFIPSGSTGIGIACISYLETFKVSMVTDDSILKDPHKLVGLIEQKLRWCIEQQQ